MTTKEKYDQVFIDSFSLTGAQLSEDVAYNQIPTWDSIGHMAMIAALETAFSISMETDDIVNFSSYRKGLEILAKYGVQVEQ